MGKKIGVVLSGCGVFDGAEIHESTLTLYFLDRAGVEVVIMAPDQPQHHVVNHYTQEVTQESRNVLVESARIARGKILPLTMAQPRELDALILPGGFGAAKNLSSIASEGPRAHVNLDLAKLVTAMHQAKKPIGAICISPAVLSLILSNQGITLTIGSDPGTAGAIKSMGNLHRDSHVDQIVVDEVNNIVTTPAYMCGASIGAVGEGIKKLVAEVVKRA